MANHIFICYARQDQTFGLHLATQLKARGVPVWLDQWDIPPSADWDQAIDEAIECCAHFLIVLSSAAIKSREVRGELRLALDENKPVLPVLFQPCRLPRQLRFIQYVDYSDRSPDDAATLDLVLTALGVAELNPPASSAKAAVRSSRQNKPAKVSPPSPKPAKVLPDRQPFEPEMILIPAGEFLMGSDPAKDNQAEEHERPQHTLYLPDYYLAKIPVTNAEYAIFVREADHNIPKHWSRGKPPGGKEKHPVVYVSWNDALAYCEWLSKVTSRDYTLPSEAEGEKGARGTDGRIYPWGDQWDARRCNSGEGRNSDTTSVDSYPDGVSAYGLLDMAGNVWEWTRSAAREYPYDPNDGREDFEAEESRVLRGGAFDLVSALVRGAARSKDLPFLAFGRDYGFRVACFPTT